MNHSQVPGAWRPDAFLAAPPLTVPLLPGVMDTPPTFRRLNRPTFGLFFVIRLVDARLQHI